LIPGGSGRRGRRREQLLYDFKKTERILGIERESNSSQCLWRTGSERCCAPVVRQVWVNCKLTLCKYDVKKMELAGLTSALQGHKLEICPELLVEYYLLLDHLCDYS
jgi:hypothetical protein